MRTTIAMPVDRFRLAPATKLRLVGEILVTYARVRWLLRRDDAENGMPQVRRWRERAPSGPVNPVERRLLGLRLGHAVIRTLSPLPADSRCLFRSLVLTSLLERRGVDTTLVVAVRPQPFAAHAWVEVDGRPVLPDGEPGFERLVEL